MAAIDHNAPRGVERRLLNVFCGDSPAFLDAQVLNPFGAGQAQPPPAYAALGVLGLYDSVTGLALEHHSGEDDESDSDDEDEDDDDMEADYVPLPDLNDHRQSEHDLS